MKYLSILFIVISFILLSCSETGKSFDTYLEFIEYQNDKGFAKIGEFNVSWPAEITRIDTASNEIKFQPAGESPQIYSGFDGYLLKAVYLRSANGSEGVIVFRSEEKN